MNVTSRIEDVTAGDEILISESTLQSLKGNYRLGRSEQINVKGIDETILVHQVAGEKT
jgi:adenylate cyclase